MLQFGLIGYPLSHSFSPTYFKAKFEQEYITNAIYSLYELKAIDELPALLKSNPALKGLNVTIPYKTSVISFLDDLDATAKNVGAVNTISIKNGKLKGYNTDVIGFKISLLNFIKDARPFALVLGTGGSSKAVTYVLNELNISYQQVSRSNQNNFLCYNDLNAGIIETYKLIINCTPLGKSPNIDSKPSLPYSTLSVKHFLFDLNYNPAQTAFMEAGKRQGANIRNGYEMLTLQADASWEIWNTK